MCPCVGGYVTVVGWDDRGQSAFIRQCVRYNRTSGQFRVFQDGLYDVVSQLAFDGPRSGIYGHKVCCAASDHGRRCLLS